jgi:hypothetical protein
MRRAWFAIAMAMACGDDTPVGDEGTTGDASTSTSPSTSSSASTSGATETTDGSTTTGESTSSESGGSTSSESGESTSSESGESTSSSSSESSESSSTSGELACTVHGVLDSVPMLARAELVDDQNFEGSCSVAGSPEAVFTFTASSTGRYHFDVLTLHSVANAVLYVLDDACGGAQIDCDSADYWDGAYTAAVSVDMFEGDTITLVAESNYEQSQFEAVDEVEIAVMAEDSCPAADLGSTVPQTIAGSLAAVPNDYLLPCSEVSTANDAGFLFTAPADGGYSFAATYSENASFTLPLFALTGGCDGEASACTSSSSLTDVDALTLRMQAGETAAVFVSGMYDNSDVHFDLVVDEVEMPTCPMAEVPAMLPAIVPSTTIAAGNDHAPSCGGAIGSDAEITFTAPTDGPYVFASQSNDVYPVVAVLDGTCEGSEIACVDPAGAGTYGEPGAVVDLVAGQEVTVVVDDRRGEAGDFDLVVERMEGDCVDEDLGALALPFDVVGSTTGATNSSASSCGGVLAPDYGVAWTASVAGSYAFSTVGSEHDATISVRDASCDGVELDCGAWGTVVQVDLAANQTVVVAIDGWQTTAGDFVLHVEEAQPPGNCCDAGGTAGCDNDLMEACVCSNSEQCCDYWDSFCVLFAEQNCDLDCG